MLTAQTAAGKQVVLTRTTSLNSLREWRKHETFYCPQCKEQVLLKAGDIVIPHFAHQQQTQCRDSFSEGESEHHLLGKAQLYELFMRHEVNVLMEPYLPAIRQRPDLLAKWCETAVPIEFQCSVIPLAHVQQRNAGYQAAAMKPIWILAAPPAVDSASNNVLTARISPFQRFFIQQRESEGGKQIPILLTYNPSSEQFHYLSHMIHLQGASYTLLHSILPCSRQTIPFAVPLAFTSDIKKLATHYQAARRKTLRSVVAFNQQGINNRFLRACYDMGIQPVQLPSWVGVPTVGQEAFKQSDCEWQLLLIAAMRETCKTPFQLDGPFYSQFAKSFDGESVEKAVACRKYAEFLREQRIDIYRLDFFLNVNYTEEILLKRFLAMHVKN